MKYTQFIMSVLALSLGSFLTVETHGGHGGGGGHGGFGGGHSFGGGHFNGGHNFAGHSNMARPSVGHSAMGQRVSHTASYTTVSHSGATHGSAPTSAAHTYTSASRPNYTSTLSHTGARPRITTHQPGFQQKNVSGTAAATKINAHPTTMSTMGKAALAGAAGAAGGYAAGKALGAKSMGMPGKQPAPIAHASQASGLNKQTAHNATQLTHAQKSAQQKIMGNKNFSHINKQQARSTVHAKGWNHWHHGPRNWHHGWWGWGWWPYGVWNWGWNWAWANGVWWWGGFPWWWWYDYDPVYFQEVVYPVYVADYQDVSGDQVPNYWQITNDTSATIVVTANQGDANVTIASGKTKQVFHAPNNTQFKVESRNGVQEYDESDIEISID